MPKTFYTERDIEDLASQGVKSLTVDENTVLTEVAREKARKLGVELLGERDSRPSSAPERPYLADKPKPKATAAAPKPSAGELQERVYSSVKARLGDQVDETLLKAIVQRVLKNVGRK